MYRKCNESVGLRVTLTFYSRRRPVKCTYIRWGISRILTSERVGVGVGVGVAVFAGSTMDQLFPILLYALNNASIK